MEKRTLEMGLKEQEDVFHRDEIKVGLGSSGQGVSGTGNGMCKATREQENLAHWWSCVRSGGTGGIAAQGRWSGRVTPGSVWEGLCTPAPGVWTLST